MAIRVDQYGAVGVVSLEGDLRGDDAAAALRGAITGAARPAAGAGPSIATFVVDFARARFIDGRGLDALLWCRAQLGDDMATLRLAGLDANCRKIFELTRLDERFELHPDLTAALKAMN
jgi:stage II sporulation protein AA (anti-sigma F factor antagonist)